MSSITTIVIADGKATPVSHTFYPSSSGFLSRWREQISGVPLIGQGVLGMLAKFDEKNASALQKIRIVLELPVQEVAGTQNAAGYTAQPKVAFTNKVICEFFLPGRGDAAMRKDIRVMLKNLLGDATIVDAIDNLVMPY